MENEIVDLLSRLANGIHARLELLPVLEELELPPYQAKLLVLAARNPGWSQQQFAAATGRDKAQVARAIKGLEARSLVTRSTHLNDPRAHEVGVTKRGQAVVARIARDRLAIGSQLLGELSSRKQAALAEMLRKLLSKL